MTDEVDYLGWVQKDLWSIFEASCLLADIEPALFRYENVHGHLPNKNFQHQGGGYIHLNEKAYPQCRKIMDLNRIFSTIKFKETTKTMGGGRIVIKIHPNEIIKVVLERNISVPLKLLKLIKKRYPAEAIPIEPAKINDTNNKTDQEKRKKSADTRIANTDKKLICNLIYELNEKSSSSIEGLAGKLHQNSQILGDEVSIDTIRQRITEAAESFANYFESEKNEKINSIYQKLTKKEN